MRQCSDAYTCHAHCGAGQVACAERDHVFHVQTHAHLHVLQAMGGAKYMVFSHKDDVADHAKWAEALGAQRIIHKGETTQRQGTEYASSINICLFLLVAACCCCISSTRQRTC